MKKKKLHQIRINLSAKIWGWWGLVPHPCPILCLVIFDYWETWHKLVMLEHVQACWSKFLILIENFYPGLLTSKSFWVSSALKCTLCRCTVCNNINVDRLFCKQPKNYCLTKIKFFLQTLDLTSLMLLHTLPPTQTVF